MIFIAFFFLKAKGLIVAKSYLHKLYLSSFVVQLYSHVRGSQKMSLYYKIRRWCMVGFKQ